MIILSLVFDNQTQPLQAEESHECCLKLHSNSCSDGAGVGLVPLTPTPWPRRGRAKHSSTCVEMMTMFYHTVVARALSSAVC